jgi:phage baseplate assembly protein W
MKAKGNGAPEQCVDNLLKTFRGEVPFERIKGLDPRTIDRSIAEGELAIRRDAEWLIGTYEPRVAVKAINVTPADGSGELDITAEIEVI